MTIATLRRRPLFGLLRCQGVTRGEIYAMVLGEAFLLGILASLIGVFLGIFLGRESVRLVSRTINDLYFVLNVQSSWIPASSLLKGILLGLLTTVLAAVMPAREAASSSPRGALIRSGLETKARAAAQVASFLGLVAITGGAVVLLISGVNLAWSFAGTFLILLGFACLTPIMTVFLMRISAKPLRRIAGLQGKLAPRNVLAAISRTSIATAALMVAVSVTIGISLMVSSFRTTVVDWLDQTLRGDIYLSPPGASAQISSTVLPEVVGKLEDWPGIEGISVIRVIQVDTPSGVIDLGATSNARETAERPFLAQAGDVEELTKDFQEGALFISEPLARRLDITLEEKTLELMTPAGLRSFPIAGIYYDYGSTVGMALMSRDIYQQIWDDESVTAVSLNVVSGIQSETLVRDLQEGLAGIQQLEIQPNEALREGALEIFDQTFQITIALQGLSMLVAFIGILSSLLTLQFEKVRELGILKAIGLSDRQLSGLVLLETSLMGSVAGVLAMPTGLILAVILIYIINRRAFGWTIHLELTASPFIEAMIIAVLAAFLAGVYPAWQMRKLQPAEALRRE
jgi:putative ABC transport system permease protein